MPFASVNNTRLFYRLEGRSGLPALVLSHSLGCDHGMWLPQMTDLLDHFQVLRYDVRGHGASDAPPGDYTLDQLGNDVLGLLDSLKIPQAAFCGISMDGAIGQWLALKAPQHLTALALANTSPKFGTPDLWETRRKAVLEGGMAEVQLGQLAQQKSESNDVKQFGAKMVNDHGQMGDKWLKPVAQQMGINPPSGPSKKDKKEMEKLQGMSGQDFDREYITMMVKDHQKDLSEFRKEASSGKSPAVKDAASQGAPIIEEHLIGGRVVERLLMPFMKGKVPGPLPGIAVDTKP